MRVLGDAACYLSNFYGLHDRLNRHRLQVKFTSTYFDVAQYKSLSTGIGAVGAVFDFYTGRVKRSHPVFQKIGLEWLPRLLQEPRRLWRRMGVSAPIFVMEVVRRRVKGQF